MAADPILFVAGEWLGAASGVLALLTGAGFLARWGIRFRLVGITSFTALLALSCLAFAISYTPRVTVPGAVVVPVVYDNGGDLVVAAAPEGLAPEAIAPTLEQVARNLRGSGRSSAGGQVRVRLRRLEPVAGDGSRPAVLGEVTRDFATGAVVATP
ncbi:Ycf51 family protein [Cyanobium sp. FGCU-52]|nr:Ycf51 family protein [Cyanobium sp. FGCU52]